MIKELDGKNELVELLLENENLPRKELLEVIETYEEWIDLVGLGRYDYFYLDVSEPSEDSDNPPKYLSSYYNFLTEEDYEDLKAQKESDRNGQEGDTSGNNETERLKELFLISQLQKLYIKLSGSKEHATQLDLIELATLINILSVTYGVIVYSEDYGSEGFDTYALVEKLAPSEFVDMVHSSVELVENQKIGGDDKILIMKRTNMSMGMSVQAELTNKQSDLLEVALEVIENL